MAVPRTQESIAIASPWDHGPLEVAPDGISLRHADGEPFLFWADTAWCLSVRATREMIDEYVETRREQRFNVLLVDLLMDHSNVLGWFPSYPDWPWRGFQRPDQPGDAYGHVPFEFDNAPEPNRDGRPDPTRPRLGPQPNDDYWDLVDYLVESAERNGLYVALLPSWLTAVWCTHVAGTEHDPSKWSLFSPDNLDAAYRYGAFLGARYAAAKNAMWVMGGDTSSADPSEYPDWVAHVYERTALGIRSAAPGHLLLYHPSGGPDSCQMAARRFPSWNDWLDVHGYQSHHWHQLQDNHYTIGKRRFRCGKPVVNLEPCYEDHPILEESPPGTPLDALPRFDAFDVRHAAYAGMFAGNAGHCYGHHATWAMYRRGEDPGQFLRQHPKRFWDSADQEGRPAGLRAEGATQMQHLKRLFASRPFFDRVPDRRILTGRTRGAIRARTPFPVAIRGDGKRRRSHWLFVYAPYGQPIEVRLKKLLGSHVNGCWYDPRTGAATALATFENRGGSRLFQPPGTEGRGNDWVLVLDNAARGYPPLGESLEA